jgi:hypothetical protein
LEVIFFLIEELFKKSTPTKLLSIVDLKKFENIEDIERKGENSK